MRFDHHHGRPGDYRHGQRYGREGERQERYFRHHRGDPRGGFGERGEGRRRFFERGEFKFALLELLASAPMHGYQLIKAMEERTGGLYSPSAGSVYPNLQLLEDMNLISSGEEDGKKLYRITDEGKAYLREREQVDSDRPGSRWERHERHRRPDGEGKRALRGLMTEWSDVIYLMAGAAQTAQDDPSSERAARFQTVMAQIREDLQKFLSESADSAKDSDRDGGAAPEEGKG